ncbi:hypothetical protein QT971_21600 [Microcoleus sp. herbarium19]|uniref:hypothetical protein n=1 Tax=unclassified Microcoleus TaxID=2642155 RepID=UPI002FD640E9
MSSTTELAASTSMLELPIIQENQEANLEEVGQLGMSQEGETAAAFFGNGYRYRHDWGNLKGQVILPLNWGLITPNSLVFVAIGEGAAGGPAAGKFIGNARYTVHNVAPQNGVVKVWVNIEWANPIRLYVDYFVFNP